jgi:hypothetical protein
MLKSVEKEFHTNDITETTKKRFFSTQKKSTKRITKFEDEAKEKFDQKRRERNLLLS